MTLSDEPLDQPRAEEPDDGLVTVADDDSDTGAMKPSTRSAIEWVAVIVCALVVALVVKTFLIQAFYIPSTSMKPTLEIGDRVLVNKLDDQPNRGDVMVFSRPGGPGADGIADLIKRVIGLPGESIEGRDGEIYIDGQLLDEPYLPESTRSKTFGPVIVSTGHVFMLGDNRQDSQDSTVFGDVPIDSIVGRAFVIIWPPSDAGGL